MRDFNAEVMFRRNYIFETIKRTFECFGYAPIETPTMENIQTLTGKYGDEGDKLIFKVLNSGDFLSNIKIDQETTTASLTKQIAEKALRYDLTVPFARFVAQNRNDITFPFKRYQMQNVWRADRPQKGRFREFYQCDADVIGTDSLFCEIELLQVYDEVFTRLGIPNVIIAVNNRKILSGIAEMMGAERYFSAIVVALDKLEKIGWEKVKEELQEKGVPEKSVELLEKFLQIKDTNELSVLLAKSAIGMQGVQELVFVMENMRELGLQSTQIQLDITLARGLDYYTGCIFEVKAKSVQLGAIGGGGRYDDLTAVFGLNDVSGVGISFGIDRIYLVLEELGLFPKDIAINTQVLFVNFGNQEAIFCMQLLKSLREKGISAELYPKNEKLKKQMNYANAKGVQFVVLIGQDEMTSGSLSVKDMKSGEQYQCTFPEFLNKLG